MPQTILDERQDSIAFKGTGEKAKGAIACGKNSLSGAVSQRACVFCGARVVLNPIADAFHLIHGPIGCASYTWDIRGSLASESDLYRNSYSTDLSERDVVFGGVEKLRSAVKEIHAVHRPKLMFIYSTCLVGIIGDDVDSVCREAEKLYGMRVINVKAPGFAGHKAMGYRLACEAIMKAISPKPETGRLPQAWPGTVNDLGDYNLAGEAWIVENYFREMGLRVLTTFTGDATYEKLKKSTRASLNVVQCAGSMTYLARSMEETFGIPYVRVSFFGLTDTESSLTKVADLIGDQKVRAKAKALCQREKELAQAQIAPYLPRLKGKKAAIFVGGGFKAISLMRQFKELGMGTVLVGTQTGTAEDYEVIEGLADEGTVILDDANPSELETFMREKGADVLVGGVKERPLAFKLGVAFCDHNHERKIPLAGFAGAVNFAREINLSVNSPVWQVLREKSAWFADQSPQASQEREAAQATEKPEAFGPNDLPKSSPGHALINQQVLQAISS
ncbi:MAG: nitrogenase iron-molybdenum cofactor biosynthesis protein NifE [Deltaproteobacteria bacterium]|jgi:nitrogenase molybdenum-cofactor synthesis protein NifE|nr:nitrogenase iron-molybdenum cofactor biosynthesis protein NifE [Deltaproteobacteria bacterium]